LSSGGIPRDSVGSFATHPPNPRLVALLAEQFAFFPKKFPPIARTCGNLGSSTCGAALHAANGPRQRVPRSRTWNRSQRCNNRRRSSCRHARWRRELQRKCAGNRHSRRNLLRRIGDTLRRQRHVRRRWKNRRRRVIPGRIHGSASARARCTRYAPPHSRIRMSAACHRRVKSLNCAELYTCWIGPH
jgi:hypothetical protein